MEADALEASVRIAINAAFQQGLSQRPGLRHVRLAKLKEKFAAGIESRIYPVVGRLIAARIVTKPRLG
jgi:hypothetical protein